jgi:predicted O-methyltransferase YrrM
MEKGIAKRLRTAIRLVLDPGRFLVIAVKPAEMIRPRGPEYAYPALMARFTRERGAMAARFAELKSLFEAPELKSCETAASGATFRNGYFTGTDAKLAYAIARHVKPRLIVEIGSGYSTHFFRKAITDAGLKTSLRCIDPAPRTEIESAADRVIRRNVFDAGPDAFADLGAGDILFVDGSHLVFNGSDVPHVFLNVLPDLAPGVLVHFHDIMLPYEYDALYTSRHYNEQYVLAVLLQGAPEWEVLYPVYFLCRQGVMPGIGTSFWLRRR